MQPPASAAARQAIVKTPSNPPTGRNRLTMIAFESVRRIAFLSDQPTNFDQVRHPMSARGSIITSPSSNKGKAISESKRYIPLFWMALITPEDWDQADDGLIELDRKVTVERGRQRLPFMARVFDEIPVFDSAANALIDRMAAVRCKTIGFDIDELTPQETEQPDFRIALEAIQQENKHFSLSIPATKEVNPFTKEVMKKPAKKIASTKELLLSMSWLTIKEITSESADIQAEYISGYMDN